jgi:hypothetical protein
MTRFADMAGTIADLSPVRLPVAPSLLSEWIDTYLMPAECDQGQVHALENTHLLHGVLSMAWSGLPPGTRTPRPITACLNAFPSVLAELERVQPKSQPKDGRRQSTNPKTCATIGFECWRTVRGRTGPQTKRLQDACGAARLWQRERRYRRLAESTLGSWASRF